MVYPPWQRQSQPEAGRDSGQDNKTAFKIEGRRGGESSKAEGRGKDSQTGLERKGQERE